MKTASIYAFVVMAIAMTATPVLAAEAVSPFVAIRTTAEQTQTENLAPNQQLPTPTPTLPTSISVRQRQPLTQTGSLTTTAGVTLTAAAEVTATAALTDTTGALAEETVLDDAALDEAYAAILEGTIIANRADAPIRFFVEGRTYEVAPLRSIGLTLLRDTAVLNLFNCEATKDDSDAGC
ncbi:MAG: hypothetical protein ACK47M_24760, partial [Caldilinea sp.]